MASNHDMAIAQLEQRFGALVTRGQSFREQHSNSITHHEMQIPDAVFFPENTDQVAEAVRLLAAQKCPIIPFGVGTSLEGHINAAHGGVSFDMSKMDKIIAIHQDDMDVVIQPGVTRERLNQDLRATGLFFPIDPGANATLGGMAATRASGTNAVRYGTMRDAVLALEVVLANGDIIRTGGRARKSSAGYDLTRLIVGSEGTLGIITELTLRLHGIPENIHGGICSFPSVKQACEAVILTIQSGVPVARLELLDTQQVRACNAYSKSDLPETPLLLVEFHGSAASVADNAAVFEDIAQGCGGGAFISSNDAEKRSRLWRVRHDAYWAALALIPGARSYTTDVCVPVSKLADCVEETQRDIEAHGIISTIVGHVGDGNFHCLCLVPPDKPEMETTLQDFVSRLSRRAIAMGGTCTGEHGVGQGKRVYLEEEAGASINVMRSIKATLDPENILNPGKIFL